MKIQSALVCDVIALCSLLKLSRYGGSVWIWDVYCFPGRGDKLTCTQQSDDAMQCSVKSSDSVHCSPYWTYFLCTFRMWLVILLTQCPLLYPGHSLPHGGRMCHWWVSCQEGSWRLPWLWPPHTASDPWQAVWWGCQESGNERGRTMNFKNYDMSHMVSLSLQIDHYSK